MTVRAVSGVAGWAAAPLSPPGPHYSLTSVAPAGAGQRVAESLRGAGLFTPNIDGRTYWSKQPVSELARSVSRVMLIDTKPL